MPLQATSGAASYDAFGGGVPSEPNYIESCFSTYLYTGNGSTQTITNGIDLSTKGGLVWIKNRTFAGSDHQLFDTARGATKRLFSNLTDAEVTTAGTLTSFDTTGFSLGTQSSVNFNTYPQVSWTFRKQPKFFDIVTWTGDGTAPRTINHNLGSTPGCIIVKRVSGGFGEDWHVFHRSLTAGQNLVLNSTAASASGSIGSPTSTTFTISSASSGNSSGYPYVAYLFAHDAGGFGALGTDNVISCGSYTGTGATLDVNLGYEVQFVLIKPTSVAGNWTMMDNMRGMTQVGVDGTARLRPNASEAEAALGGSYGVFPNATGFTVKSSPGVDDYNASGQTYIYIAIRRGPMKVPTSGTSVFAPVTATAPASPYTITTNFPVDLSIVAFRNTVAGKTVLDRLRGSSTTTYASVNTHSADAESTGTGIGIGFQNNTAAIDNSWASGYGNNPIWWNFRRAPSFFDEACYTGNGSTQNITHNLGVAPELMIVKMRSATSATGWIVYAAPLANAATSYLVLNSTDAVVTGNSVLWNSTAPTSSVFSLAASSNINTSGATNVAYLFATCAGVSKVGSYTGNGSTQTINCGFGAGGARFVLIKRADSTGGWYAYDTARGMTVLTDPYTFLNDTSAETATLGSVTTVSTGFALNSSVLAAINISGGSYIFLAVS